MLLNDRQIIEYVKKYNMIDPFIPHKVVCGLSKGLEPAGYTLSLDNIFKVAYSLEKDTIIDPCYPTTQHYVDYCITKDALDQRFYLKGYGHCLVQVQEYIKLPLDVAADLWPKSSYLRIGVIPHLALIENGWEGNLTIEIYNTNPNPVALYVGQGIVQIRFHKMEHAQQGYEGYYQGITSPEVSLALE